MRDSRYGCDVAIVGGGLAGATLAAALRRWPLSVAVIDPGRGEGGDGRSLALSYGSARLYRTLGLWEEIGREAAPIREVHVSRRGRLGFTRIRAGECGVDALGYVVPARSLQGRLNEALGVDPGPQPGSSPGRGPDPRCGPYPGPDAGADADTAFDPVPGSGIGVGTRTGTATGAGTGPAAFEWIRARVEAVEAHGRDALVEACGPDGAVSVAARLVVGADGADSAVRRAAGLPLRVHRCDHVALAGDLLPERPHRGRAFERFTERGPLAVLPLDEERCGFVWAVPEPVAAAEGFDGSSLGARLADGFGSRLGALRGVDLRVRRPLRVCHAPRVTAPRTVLVGNAANALHPVGAQGFNLGLRDVETLARLLGEASAAGADPASVLARYAAERRADHVMARLMTSALLRVYGSRAPPLPALGAAGLFALDRLGPVKRGFAKIAMGGGWGCGRDAMAGARACAGLGKVVGEVVGEVAGVGRGSDEGLRRARRGMRRGEARGAARHGG